MQMYKLEYLLYFKLEESLKEIGIHLYLGTYKKYNNN